MDEILVVHHESVQADPGSDRLGGLYGCLQPVHDGPDNYPRSEDVDDHGLDIPPAKGGPPVGRLRLAGYRSHSDVPDLRVLPGNHHARYRRADGEIEVDYDVLWMLLEIEYDQRLALRIVSYTDST